MISLKTKGHSGFLSMLSFLSFLFTGFYYSGLGDKRASWFQSCSDQQHWAASRYDISPLHSWTMRPLLQERKIQPCDIKILNPRFSFISLGGSVPESRCLSFNRFFSSSYWTVAMTLGWDRPLHGVSKWSSFINAFLICSGTLPSHQHFMLQLLQMWSLLSGNSK